MTKYTQRQLEDLLVDHFGFERDRIFRGRPRDGYEVPEGGVQAHRGSSRFYVYSDLSVRELGRAGQGTFSHQSVTMEQELKSHAEVRPHLSERQIGELAVLNALIRAYQEQIEEIYRNPAK